ncbi:MAG: LamG domain-containing protein [Theionarchaea archaeon]|nr:LamG domain-containing protein [Theionarchaea archaeon]
MQHLKKVRKGEVLAWILIFIVVGVLTLYLLTMSYRAWSSMVVDDNQSDFDQGVYSSTTWNMSRVELTSVGRTEGFGIYTSSIKDARREAAWNTISWGEPIPYKEELPNNKGTDSGADMDGNVLLLHLNELSGVITDYSGYGNNGTCEGGVTYGVPGRYNTALRFDGANDSVRIADSESLNISGSITLEAWINPASTIDSSNSNIRVIDKQRAYYFLFDYPTADGRLKFVLRIGGNYIYLFSTTSTWTQGQWYHIVGTYDGSYMRLYVNGALENSQPQTGNIANTPVDLFRGILNVRVRVRSCDDNSCSGESWSSYYTDASGNSLSQPNNRYFQYEVYVETEDPDYTPELESVTIDRTLESAGPQTVVESVMVETASLILGISFLMYKFYLPSAN